MVDRIEYFVDIHVGQARGELIKAEEYRNEARKVNESDSKRSIAAGEIISFRSSRSSLFNRVPIVTGTIRIYTTPLCIVEDDSSNES